jgi:hypothetical protein
VIAHGMPDLARAVQDAKRVCELNALRHLPIVPTPSLPPPATKGSSVGTFRSPDAGRARRYAELSSCICSTLLLKERAPAAEHLAARQPPGVPEEAGGISGG